MAMSSWFIYSQRYTGLFQEQCLEHFFCLYFNFNRHFFTFQASRSHCIYFVSRHSQWRTTPSCLVPRICSNLDSWI